jgi:hypothetical protein
MLISALKVALNDSVITDPTFCGGGVLLENAKSLMLVKSMVRGPATNISCTPTYCPPNGGRFGELVSMAPYPPPGVQLAKMATAEVMITRE